MIQKIMFDGFDAIEFLTEKVRLVLVTGCGPRIAFLGKKDGANLLYWKKDDAIRGDWHLHGGHRVWITRPYADESEDAYMADNEPCSVEQEVNKVTATAPAHTHTMLSRGMIVEQLSDTSFNVTNFIRNDGQMISSGGVWSPTCINPEGVTMSVDLGEDDSTWDIVKIVIPRKFAGNTVLLNDPQVTLTEEQMIVKPNGVLTKRCVCAPKGIIRAAYEKEGVTFEKYSPYKRDGSYPLDGCNIAAFVGQENWMAELETFGVEQAIRPNETICNCETWRVLGV